jgi:PAS domain S-box-containing protein
VNGKKHIALVKQPSPFDANRFKALIENAYDGIVLYDQDGIIQYASPSIKNWGGFTPHDLVGRRGTDFVFEEDVPAASQAFYNVLQQPGKSITLTQRFLNKTGQARWSEYTLTNLLHNPHVRGVVSNFHDIHERKLAEDAALNASKLLNTISENVVDGIFYGIPGEEFQYVNNAFFKNTGYKSLQELKKIKPHHLFAEVERWKELNAKLEKEGSLKNEEALFRRKNGEIFWGSISLAVFKNENGEIRFVGSVQDISGHKKAQEQLQQSQQLLKAISQNINEGLFRSDGKRFQYVNEAFVRMFGYSSIDELLHTRPQKLYAHVKERKGILDQIRKHHVYTCEVLYRRKNGSHFWGQVSYKAVPNHRGGLIMDGSIRDITKQKEAEQQLNASRTFLDNVMKTVAAPIFVKDARHHWVMFNDAFCWFMGKKRSELIGKSEIDFFQEDAWKKSRKTDNQVLRTGDPILSRDTIWLKKEIVRHTLTVKSRFVNEAGEKFVIGFITDISEIREREAEINKLNANLLGVMESTHESIYAIDRNFKYLAFNKNHARMSKLIYGATISIGSSSIEFIKNTAEEKWLMAELKRAMRGEHFVSEQHISQPRYKDKFIQTTYNPIFDNKNYVTGVAVFVRDVTDYKKVQEAINHTNATLSGVIESTNERIFAVDIDFRYLMFNRSHALAMKVISNKEIKLGDNILKLLPKDLGIKAKRQFRLAFKDTPSSLEFTLLDQYLEASVNPIKNTNGKVIGATMFVRDITHRKKVEEKLRLLNEELTEQNWRLAAQEEELKATLEELSERNFELDQLMYKTSHDLRSPLSSILGLVNLAHLDTDAQHQREYLDKIEGRIKKLDEFIRSMLNYARVNRSEQVIEVIDFHELITNSIQELEYLDNFSKMNTSLNIVNESVPFKCDVLLLKIIFSNIVSNAYKYFNPLKPSYLKIKVEITPVNAIITLRDNGIGIEKEHVKRVFDMFYRATEKSQGSGLGMYIVKQAVDKLRGTIEVKSTYGKGTTFKIVLPNY